MVFSIPTMKLRTTVTCLSFVVLCTILVYAALVEAWEANWESLDSRPVPAWYEDAKFGIFIVWGIYAVPSFGSEWFWKYWHDGYTGQAEYINKTENPRFAYADYVHRFDATLYRPDRDWSDMFAKSGAQYVVMTSKHQEGFCNWDSRDIATTWNWNSMDVGPRRDLLGELAAAVKKTTSIQTQNRIRFGAYHSLWEWFNPLYLQDEASNWTQQNFVNMKTLPELYDLVNKYEPELIWSDGPTHALSSYWRSAEFLAWYATNSSVAETAVWNDRWGVENNCRNGAFLTCSDRYRPGELKVKKWEYALTIDRSSWGWNRNSHHSQYLPTKELIHELIETVAFNGNMLLSVGPAADGTISPIFVDRLVQIGEWLSVNGDAIYGTRYWSVVQNETASNVFYTTKEDTLYAIFTKWPTGSHLKLKHPVPGDATKVKMLGVDGDLEWSTNHPGGMEIVLPLLTPDVVPCQHAWTVAMTGLDTTTSQSTEDTRLRGIESSKIGSEE